MLQYHLIKCSSGFLRWYRTFVTLDMGQLHKHLPASGTILDVGCGVGSVDYVLAKDNPNLRIHGIDITPESIAMAKEYHTLPNVKFECRPIEEVQGQFDCVLFMDVFHHVPPKSRDSILQAAARLVSPRGFVFIKDISRRGGFVSWLMDRYVSGYPADEIFLENLPDMEALVSKHLKIVSTHKRYRFPFPRYYVKAAQRPA